MDNQSQERYTPANTADDQSQQLVPYSPSTPSTPPTREAPDGTNTRASQPESRVSFLAEPPRTSLQLPHREPLHPGEHVRVLQTEIGFGDVAGIYPDDPRSLPTRTPTWYPSGTRYSLIEERPARCEGGQRLVAVSEDPCPIFIRGSMLYLPENTLVKLGTSTIVRPIFGHCQSGSHEAAPPPVSQSARVSNMARRLNEYMRQRSSRDDGE